MLNSGNKIEVSWVLSKICLCELTDLELWTLFSTVGIMPIDIIYIIIDFKKCYLPCCLSSLRRLFFA